MIRSLPESIDQLTQLRSLNLSSSKVTQLSNGLHTLQELRSLKLASLPPDIQWDDCFSVVATMKSLENLSLHSNSLTKVPDWISSLSQLQTLNLSANNITELPLGLQELRNLKRLLLSDNALRELPEFNQWKQLEHLSVSYNELQHIPFSIHMLPKLTQFLFDGNPIPAARMQELFSYFPDSLPIQDKWQRRRSNILFVLKSSRPGLWFPTIWLYLLPFTGQTKIETDIPFLLGLLFVSLPLNLLIYGWNDIVDEQTDRINPRKDSYLFGARGSLAQQDVAIITCYTIHMLLWPTLIFYGGWKMLLLLGAILLNCYLYNHPKKGWRGRPGLDLLAQVGYLIVPILSSWVNTIPLLDLNVWIYLALFCTQSQLIGEVMDIEPDRLAGRRNTAVVLGRMPTKWIIIAIVLMEILMLGFVFGDWYFAGGMSFFLLWLVLDAVVIFKDKNYVQWQFQLFAIGSNIVAVISLIYIMATGLFKPTL